MTLFDNWCKNSREEDGQKLFLKFTEKSGGRAATQTQLSETIRSHYDSLERIADEVKKLGYKTAAKILRERLPRTKKARSGDLGEILAAEVVEEKLDFKVPVRRMRYKDGREVPLRGDDFIGIRFDKKTGLHLLKGESKSRSTLGKDTITAARAALNRYHGRCSPTSLLFIADRLLDRNGKSAELGRAIRKEVGTNALRKKQIDHALFTLSGNSPPSALKEDLQNADSGRKQTVINVWIEDHQEFIAHIYKEAGKLGNVEELESFLAEATRDGVWGQLLDRGTAWAIMRQEGVLPPDAPAFGETLETDLAEYGFSVLRAALALREVGGNLAVVQRSFERAANAFEALVRNGSPKTVERGFYRIIAGAAYHLAGYSAIAYSLFNQQGLEANYAPCENALILLILRDLDALRVLTRNWLLSDANSDAAVAASLQDHGSDIEDAVAIVINSTICRAFAYFDFALQTGESSLSEIATQLLERAVKLAAHAGAVSLWWIARLCRNFVSDLWDHSMHVNLPSKPPKGGEEDYANLRRFFLVSLYGRKNAEVELWPSQLEAARRSTDITDDLVVSLPTSAGKTRVAGIAALMTLSTKKRVLIVTPLRALSAQTERSFRKTFGPLGFTVSSLYGASGISAGDEDALRTKNIVIATPEKLDFALRNDTTLINDVGLIVLDEGHLIGPSEREIRYEILVQRLLHRTDAASRRIVCLSAILPDGKQLDDLTAWIRSDADGKPVKSQWRPTRQRFGTLVWQGTSARLSYDLDENGPYLARFVEQVAPRHKELKPYPKETKDLTLFAAWKFAAQGRRTLIFSTQANWVEGYGKKALELVGRGHLTSLLDKPDSIARALEVGREWLGDSHPAVQCLSIGLAIHHGGLPNVFLREIEILLSEGVLKVVVASPTLSQGLNLNAAVLLVPSLYRSGKPITGEEFANVAGRAGRAFVDVEGLVLHVMYEDQWWRHKMWRSIVASAKSRSLKSGLVQVVAEIIDRLSQEGVLSRQDAFEYLANSRDAWKSEEEKVEEPDEDSEDDEAAKEPLSELVEKLDATVFGLVEALDANSEDLPQLLDEALKGSLWARQIAKETGDTKLLHKAILDARAQLIWNNTTPLSRKGHFAMGVGLEAGLQLDSLAKKMSALIDKADNASLSGDEDALAEALINLAKHLLSIRPFTPAKKKCTSTQLERDFEGMDNRH